MGRACSMNVPKEWWESQKERKTTRKTQDVGGWIILNES
jgi:hypothetical protein